MVTSRKSKVLQEVIRINKEELLPQHAILSVDPARYIHPTMLDFSYLQLRDGVLYCSAGMFYFGEEHYDKYRKGWALGVTINNYCEPEWAYGNRAICASKEHYVALSDAPGSKLQDKMLKMLIKRSRALSVPVDTFMEMLQGQQLF
jgi:hypothetical protein